MHVHYVKTHVSIFPKRKSISGNGCLPHFWKTGPWGEGMGMAGQKRFEKVAFNREALFRLNNMKRVAPKLIFLKACFSDSENEALGNFRGKKMLTFAR